MVGTLPCQGAVGVVIEHNIHACVRQHLRLLAEHPLICGTVEAVNRLVPEAVMPRSPPCNVVIVVLCIRILLEQFGRIGCALLTQLLVPCPVKQRQRLAVAHGTDIRKSQRLAPQSVGKHPCVRHGCILAEQAVRRDAGLLGRRVRFLFFILKCCEERGRLGGETDGQAQIHLFLAPAHVHQSVRHAVAFHCPHADLSARLADQDVVFPGRLCVKGQFRHAVVGQRIKKSGRNRLACLGSRVIPVPLIQGELCGGIGRAPCAQRQRHRIKRTVDAEPQPQLGVFLDLLRNLIGIRLRIGRVGIRFICRRRKNQNSHSRQQHYRRQQYCRHPAESGGHVRVTHSCFLSGAADPPAALCSSCCMCCQGSTVIRCGISAACSMHPT